MTRGKSYGDLSASGPEIHLADDELIDLQGRVLDALEDVRPDLFTSADRDPALKDSATMSQRKAWLAIYGPPSGLAI